MELREYQLFIYCFLIYGVVWPFLAFAEYRLWEEEIEKWQDPILKDDKLPEWYKLSFLSMYIYYHLLVNL